MWSAILADLISSMADFEASLSPEEKHRANRFLRAEDRSRYVFAHGILRQLLGQYLSTDPVGLKFRPNIHGKPALVQEPGQPVLTFNLTHSGEVILIAFAENRQVGVDVEVVREDFDPMEIARSQFAEREIAGLRGMTDRLEQLQAFFRCWTRKEAYVKARGEGMGFPLSHFAVAFGAAEPPRVTWSADDPFVSSRWAMINLDPLPGYAGALVADRPPVQVLTRQWGHGQ